MAILPIEDGIKDTLVTASIGVFQSDVATETGIWIGKEAVDAPDKAVVITQSGGFAANPKWLLDNPSIQVRVRGDKGEYKAASLKARDVKDVLLGCPSVTVNGDRWVSITMPSDMMFLGYDENERPMFSLNFQMIVEPQASGLTKRQAL